MAAAEFSDPSRMQIHDDYYDGNYGIESVGIKEMFIGFAEKEIQSRWGGLKTERMGEYSILP